MKCAYCKKEVNANDNTYEVEINEVECEIALHYDCLIKVIGEYFTRPKEIKPMSNNRITIDPNDRDRRWATPQAINYGGTADCPPPDTTRVWCKANDESTHAPWKDRVD